MTTTATDFALFENYNGTYMPAEPDEAIHYIPDTVRAAVRKLTESRIVWCETYYGGWSAPDWEYGIKTLAGECLFVDWGDNPWEPEATAYFCDEIDLYE